MKINLKFIKKIEFPKINVKKIKIAKLFQFRFKKVKLEKKLSKKLVWALVVILILYILIGVGFAISIYKYHSRNEATQYTAKIYPFVAAWVGFNPIWVKDYYQLDSYNQRYYLETSSPIPDDEILRELIIDQLVDIKLHQRAVKRYSLKINSDEVTSAYNKIREDENYTEEEMQQVLVKMYGMTENGLKSLIKDQLTIEKVQNELFDSVKVSHILIKDEGLAKEVLNKAIQGEDFSELAKKYSEDIATNESGGDLGWNKKGDLIKEIEDKAFTLNSGEVGSEIIKTEQFGYHIIKVTDKKIGKIDKNYQDWLDEEKNNTKIIKWLK